MPNSAPTLRLLHGDPADMAAMQRVLEAAPRYADRVTGLPVGAADAPNTCSILPSGKRYGDRFVGDVFA